MNIFKRSTTALKRQKFRTILFFSTLVILGGLLFFSLSIRQSVINIDIGLRSRMPAIATIHVDDERVNAARVNSAEWIYIENVRPDLIREFGRTNWVRSYDFTAWGHHFFSPTYRRVFNEELFFSLDTPITNPIDTGSFMLREGGNFENFVLKGIENHRILDVESGLINLDQGRVFTYEEVAQGEKVIFVSTEFLHNNELSLGGYISLEYHIFNDGCDETGVCQGLLNHTLFDFRIIGTFEHELESLDLSNIQAHIDFKNRMYVPNRVIESLIPLYIETFKEINPLAIEHLTDGGSPEDILSYENIVFLLHDPLDLLAFKSHVEENLPEFWAVSDLSNAYAEISNAMSFLNGLADQILIGTIVMAVLVLNILILIFLKERKIEFGILLALGERRQKIIFQVLLEFFIIVFAAGIVSIILANGISGTISTNIFQGQVQREFEVDRTLIMQTNSPEHLGFRIDMTHEEMMELYNTRISFQIVIVYKLILFLMSLLSTVVPLMFMFKIYPKQLLDKF